MLLATGLGLLAFLSAAFTDVHPIFPSVLWLCAIGLMLASMASLMWASLRERRRTRRSRRTRR